MFSVLRKVNVRQGKITVSWSFQWISDSRKTVKNKMTTFTGAMVGLSNAFLSFSISFYCVRDVISHVSCVMLISHFVLD